jgi:hypothetical protein
MTILYPTPAPVKSRPFGLGIFAPAREPEPSADDRRWWAEQTSARELAEFNRHLEELAFESAALDRYQRGVITDMDLAAVGAVG